jgi:hypothetical protein
MLRDEQPAQDAGVLAALRATVGCRYSGLARLTPEEQHNCDRIARADRASAEPAQFGVAPSKRAIFDAASKRDSVIQMLSEKPSNGCKPRIATQNAPPGSRSQVDVPTTVSCAFSF